MIGQLTYACFAATPGRAGGWRIGEQAGLSPEQAKWLQQKVAARFPEDGSLPRFPTPSDLERRPRRLRFVPLNGFSAFWHTVAAGIDASGRPGNSFTHAALVETAQLPADWIPVHAWRSPSWSVPYGAEAVQSAGLMKDIPGRGPFSDLDKVIDFIVERPERTQMWAILLDALHNIQSGSGSIVLLCDSADEAAGWIAAMTSTVVKAVARLLSFAIWERASESEADWKAHHLVCTDRSSLRGEFTSRPGLWVIDTKGSAGPEYLAGSSVWMGAGADGLPVSDWSQVALDVVGAGVNQLRYCLKSVAEGDRSDHWLADFGSAVLTLPELDLSHEQAHAFVAPAAAARVSDRHAATQNSSATTRQLAGTVHTDPPVRGRVASRPAPAGIAALLRRALEDGAFEDFRTLAARATPAEVNEAELGPEIASQSDWFGKQIERSADPVDDAIRALQFGDACFALSPEAGLLEDASYVPVMRLVVQLLLGAEGERMIPALASCRPPFVIQWVRPEIDDYLSSKDPSSIRLSPAVASWFAGFFGSLALWNVAVRGKGTPLEKLVLRCRVEGGDSPYLWLRASRAVRSDGEMLAPVGGHMPPLTSAEMDWMLSEAASANEQAALWGSAEFLRALDWPIGGHAQRWANEALRKFSGVIKDPDLLGRLRVYRDVPTSWWKAAEWMRSAEQLLSYGGSGTSWSTSQLLVDVATAVLMAAVACDLRLSEPYLVSGAIGASLRERALVVVRQAFPLVVLGGRQAAERLVGLAENDRHEEWSVRCAILLVTEAGPAPGSSRPHPLTRALESPLPSASWRGEPSDVSALDLCVASRRVQEHLRDIAGGGWERTDPQVEDAARRALTMAQKRFR